MTNPVIVTPGVAPAATAQIGSEPGPQSAIEEVERQRAGHLARRLMLAFYDLGLDRAVPDGWVSVVKGDLAFGDLTPSQADNLIRALENLAAGRPSTSSDPGPGQLRLF